MAELISADQRLFKEIFKVVNVSLYPQPDQCQGTGSPLQSHGRGQRNCSGEREALQRHSTEPCPPITQRGLQGLQPGSRSR